MARASISAKLIAQIARLQKAWELPAGESPIPPTIKRPTDASRRLWSGFRLSTGGRGKMTPPRRARWLISRTGSARILFAIALLAVGCHKPATDAAAAGPGQAMPV